MIKLHHPSPHHPLRVRYQPLLDINSLQKLQTAALISFFYNFFLSTWNSFLKSHIITRTYFYLQFWGIFQFSFIWMVIWFVWLIIQWNVSLTIQYSPPSDWLRGMKNLAQKTKHNNISNVTRAGISEQTWPKGSFALKWQISLKHKWYFANNPDQKMRSVAQNLDFCLPITSYRHLDLFISWKVQKLVKAENAGLQYALYYMLNAKLYFKASKNRVHEHLQLILKLCIKDMLKESTKKTRKRQHFLITLEVNTQIYC